MNSSDSKEYFLRNLDIYDGVSEEELIRIAQNSFECSYKKKSLLYSPHEENQNVYVLKKGEIELYHVKEGKQQVFDILTPGTVFGNFDLQNPFPSHFAYCKKDCYLCVTPLSDFLNIISKYPELMLKFMQKMALRMKEYENKIEIGLGSASEKILFELKRLKEKRSRSFLGKYFPIPLRVTHEELSALTGLNRVTVTRTLQSLAKENKVHINKKTGAIELM